MAKKQDTFYFDTFIACAEHAVEASRILRRCIDSYDPDNLDPFLSEMHMTEHAADKKKHELTNVLAKAFITPIERDDIILLSQCLDEVVDKIEDVVLRLYCDNVRTLRPDMEAAVDVVERCCSEGSDHAVTDGERDGSNTHNTSLSGREPLSDQDGQCEGTIHNRKNSTQTVNNTPYHLHGAGNIARDKHNAKKRYDRQYAENSAKFLNTLQSSNEVGSDQLDHNTSDRCACIDIGQSLLSAIQVRKYVQGIVTDCRICKECSRNPDDQQPASDAISFHLVLFHTKIPPKLK